MQDSTELNCPSLPNRLRFFLLATASIVSIFCVTFIHSTVGLLELVADSFSLPLFEENGTHEPEAFPPAVTDFLERVQQAILLVHDVRLEFSPGSEDGSCIRIRRPGLCLLLQALLEYEV